MGTCPLLCPSAFPGLSQDTLAVCRVQPCLQHPGLGSCSVTFVPGEPSAAGVPKMWEQQEEGQERSLPGDTPAHAPCGWQWWSTGAAGETGEAEDKGFGWVSAVTGDNSEHQQCLQNDHKALMKQVEEALHQLHAREKEKQARDEAEALAEAMSQAQSVPQAFAKVNAVTPGSPASISGLQVDDEIVEFGSVNVNNFQNLQNIATVVQHSEGRPLSVTVLRGGKKVHVGLTPKPAVSLTRMVEAFTQLRAGFLRLGQLSALLSACAAARSGGLHQRVPAGSRRLTVLHSDVRG
uniref:26S proteasome non-ATPase regulatory subunit 9 n=1 Tax=Calidris pygmaea TaxID=425635 RepID=A0A8C3J3Q4_9CHAR